MVGRMSGFSLSVGLATLMGIISVPLLVASLGPSTWGILTLTQTVAQFAGVFVAFGWGATGAATVATLQTSERQAFYRQSLRARVTLYCCVAPIAATVLALLTRGEVLVAVLGAFVYLLPHLGGTWYFAGESRPLRIFLLDTVPGAIGTVAGLVAASLTGELWAFLAFQGLGYLAAGVLDARTILSGSPRTSSRASLAASLRQQRHAVTASATTAFYVALPLVAVQIFLPSWLPFYAMADRLFRYASLALLPVQQYFQGWVPSVPGALRHRARAATMAGLCVATVAGAGIALLSPLASRLLSGGEIDVPFTLSIPLGVAFVGVGTAAIVGYACLVAVGRVRALAVSTVIGAGLGVPFILAFAIAGELALLAWAVAVSELAVALYQCLALRTALADRRAEETADRQDVRPVLP